MQSFETPCYLFSHGDDLPQMFRPLGLSDDVLFGVGQANLELVEIAHLRGNIGWRQGAHDEVGSFQDVGEAKGIYEILRQRRTILPRFDVQDIRGKSGGAEIGSSLPDLQWSRPTSTVEPHPGRAPPQSIIYEMIREPHNVPVEVDARSRSPIDLQRFFMCYGDPHRPQQLPGSPIDLTQLPVTQSSHPRNHGHAPQRTPEINAVLTTGPQVSSAPPVARDPLPRRSRRWS